MVLRQHNFPETNYQQPEKETPPKLTVIEGGKNFLTQEQLEEAYQWQDYFKQGWITAHEMATLPQASRPEIEGERIKQDTGKIQEIQHILEKALFENDENFQSKYLEDIKKSLPSVFDELYGLEQSPPHAGIDPAEHTFNALRELDTSHLSSEDRYVARLTLLLHDVGKVYNPTDRNHPRRSAELMAESLKKVIADDELRERILHHIKWHDVLGDASRRDGQNILNAEDVRTYFPNKTELAVHKEIVLADVKSIPGLRDESGRIEAFYNALNNDFQKQRDWIKVKCNQFTLPFEKVDIAAYNAVYHKIFQEESFDDIDIDEDMQKRAETFFSLTDDEREVVERMIVQSALFNEERLLQSLKLTGRETDLGYAAELEQRYGVKLDSVKIAAHMFSMTYRMWELNHEVRRIGDDESLDDDVKRVKEKIEKIKYSAKDLAQYNVEATHVTRTESEGSIDYSQTLWKSESGKSSHYEGDGVYAGVLGSYREWRGGDKVYTMQIPLSGSLPTIVSNNYPKAMANVLCESLFIQSDTDLPAIPHGLIQWRQCEYDYDEINDWKIDLLSELLKTPVQKIKDEQGRECLIADTAEPPIVWGSLCRALRIRRFIPLAQLPKLSQSFSKEYNNVPSHTEHLNNDLDVSVPNTSYQSKDDDNYEELASGASLKGRHGNRL
jgi:hypothetical protein